MPMRDDNCPLKSASIMSGAPLCSHSHSVSDNAQDCCGIVQKTLTKSEGGMYSFRISKDLREAAVSTDTDIAKGPFSVSSISALRYPDDNLWLSDASHEVSPLFYLTECISAWRIEGNPASRGLVTSLLSTTPPCLFPSLRSP